MEDLGKLRLLGAVVCTVALAGFGTVTYSYWGEWKETRTGTVCGDWEALYEWEVGQHALWMAAVTVLLWVVVLPDKYCFLLVPLYLLGPVLFTLTVSSLISFVSFTSCCAAAQDSCLRLSGYQAASLVYGQMLVSLLMAALLSLALLCVLACVVWAYLEKIIQDSVHRLRSQTYSLIV